jgi:transcriptional regulator with XRE-family HTH domain
VGEPDKEAIRRKVLGVLLRHVRVRSGRSQTELAAALHVSRNRYAQYESGQRDLSLPELELVAELCGVPLSYFFDDKATVQDEGGEPACQVTLRLQRKILGTLLRQTRLQAGKLPKDCAAALGISTRLFAQYEDGEREIPSGQLETLAAFLGVPASYFAVCT